MYPDNGHPMVQIPIKSLPEMKRCRAISAALYKVMGVGEVNFTIGDGGAQIQVLFREATHQLVAHDLVKEKLQDVARDLLLQQ